MVLFDRVLGMFDQPLEQDGSVKVWDLRMAPSSAGDRPAPPPLPGMPICTHSMRAAKGCVKAFASHGDDVVASMDGSVGAFSLTTPTGGVLDALRVRNERGVGKPAKIVGLAMLPHSRLLLVGQDSGYVCVCR